MFICWAQVRSTDGCHFDLNMVPNIAPGVCQLFVGIAIRSRRPCAAGVCFFNFIYMPGYPGKVVGARGYAVGTAIV